MPIYEYRCLKCGHQFEKLQSISEDAVKKCEKCGSRVTRLFHPVAVHFKGSGFYSTDYGRRSASKRSSEEKPKKKESKEPGKKAAAGSSE